MVCYSSVATQQNTRLTECSLIRSSSVFYWPIIIHCNSQLIIRGRICYNDMQRSEWQQCLTTEFLQWINFTNEWTASISIRTAWDLHSGDMLRRSSERHPWLNQNEMRKVMEHYLRAKATLLVITSALTAIALLTKTPKKADDLNVLVHLFVRVGIRVFPKRNFILPIQSSDPVTRDPCIRHDCSLFWTTVKPWVRRRILKSTIAVRLINLYF